MRQFFLNLLNANDPNSSKRFAGLTILGTTIGLAITATINNHGNCPEGMFNSLLIFAGMCFGFNMVENIMKKPEPTTDPVEEEKIDTP